jgi:hypothetical protein
VVVMIIVVGYYNFAHGRLPLASLYYCSDDIWAITSRG